MFFLRESLRQVLLYYSFYSSVDTDLNKFPKDLHSLMRKLMGQSKMNKISFYLNVKLSTSMFYSFYSSVDTDLHKLPKHLHSLMGKLMGQSKMNKISLNKRNQLLKFVLKNKVGYISFINSYQSISFIAYTSWIKLSVS